MRFKRGGFTIAFIVFGMVVLVFSSFFYFSYRGKALRDDVVVGVVSDYPLRLKSGVGSDLDYVLFDSSNNRLQSGVVSQSYVETYIGASSNVSYTVFFGGDDYYWSSVTCVQSSLTDYCVLSPEKIGNVSLSFENDELTILVVDGIVQKAVVCVAWGSNTVAVTFDDFERFPVPNRFIALADICFGLGDLSDKVVVSVNVLKRERDLDVFSFFLIDLEVVNSEFERSYEVDTGLEDYLFTVDR